MVVQKYLIDSIFLDNTTTHTREWWGLEHDIGDYSYVIVYNP